MQVPTLQSRRLASANPALKNSFNKDKTRAQLEAMSVFSETAMRIVGDVYAKYDRAVSDAERKLLQARAGGNATTIAQADAELKTAQTAKAEIEDERAVAHGLVGALTAALGGTSPVSGFIGGTAGKLVTTELDKLLSDNAWAIKNPTAANLIKTLSATAAGSITGGTTGGFVASNGDLNKGDATL